MKWFRKAITETIEKKYAIPQNIIDGINTAKGGKIKEIFIEYLKTLDRVDFLRAGDEYNKIWPSKHDKHDWLWEAYNDVEWGLEYPMTKRLYETIETQALEAIPMWYDRGTNPKGPVLDLNKLVKQIEGIQKKLDKALLLISNAEFKLCGKDAMKL